VSNNVIPLSHAAFIARNEALRPTRPITDPQPNPSTGVRSFPQTLSIIDPILTGAI
jgi:hypothetical protein